MIREVLYRGLKTGMALTIGLASAATAAAQVTAPARLITSAVDNGDRVVLGGSLSHAMKSATDLGAANTSLSGRYIDIVLQRGTAQQAALDQYLMDVQNPRSSEYHHWLTPVEYGTRFGSSSDDVQTISAWLQAQGLKVEKVSPAANVITVSGTVGQLQSAFSVHIHSILVNGEKHVANMELPQVPRALAPAIKGVTGLDDFRPKSTFQKGPTAKFDAATKRIEPDFTVSSEGQPLLFTDPADAATIYNTPNANLNPNYKGTTYDGSGVTVGVVGDSNVDLAPVTNYRVGFLGETASNVNLPTVIIDGADPGQTEDVVEAWLDLEVLGGIAPKAKLNYYISQDTDISSGLLDAVQRAVNDNAVSVLSMSYGACESTIGSAANQFLAELYQQAAAQGITVVVSTGDSGAAACDSDGAVAAVNGLAVNGLASTPYNVAVGGTDYDVLLNSFSSYVDTSSSGAPPYWRTALQYIPEEPWNDSTYPNNALANNSPVYIKGVTDDIGGGGGKSSVYAKPAFQSALTPNDGARDVPDVSFLAGNGLYGAAWVICEQNYILGPECASENGTFLSQARFTGAGGTSAATPAFAGILALVVQATGSRLGQANNVLYNLASAKYSTVFHDVTNGNNAVYCQPNSADCGANNFTTGYDAGTGYDLASGFGSVDATALILNWQSGAGASSTTTLTVNGSNAPLSVTHGASLDFKLAVDPASATGSAALLNGGTNAALGSLFSIPVSAGAGEASYNGLPGGQYSVYARFSGDTNTAASVSNPINVNIAAEDSTTKLWLNAYSVTDGSAYSDLTALPYGAYIFAESTVYGTAEGLNTSQGSATGAMTVLDNGKTIGTAPISAGNLASFPALAQNAVYPLAFPYPAGTHKITVNYPGDASYKKNTSNEVDFTVVQGQTVVSMVPATPTLSSTSKDAIEVFVDTTSFGGPATGTITLTANGVTLASSSSLNYANRINTSTALTYVELTIDGSKLAPGVNTITATYSGDSNYVGSSGTITLTNVQSAFTLTAGSISVTAGSTLGNTGAVAVVPSGTFAGPVSLACSITSTPSNATSPITCSVPSSVVVTGIGAASAALSIGSTTTTTAGTYVVTVAGKDATGAITASATSMVTVVAPLAAPGITLSGNTTMTITAGAASGNKSNLAVTPMNGFTGVVNISCAVTSAPANANDPVTCGVSPAVVNISGSVAASSELTINSTGGTTIAFDHHGNLLSAVGGSVLAGVVLLWIPRRRRGYVRLLMLMPGIVLLCAMVGCSGGSANNGAGMQSQPGTTAGTYVVTVTANPAGADTKTSTVTVTVN